MMMIIKFHGIPLLLIFSFFLTICICAHIPNNPKQSSSSSTTLDVANANKIMNKVSKYTKRDLVEQDEDDNVIFPMVISKRSATALGKLMHLLRTSMDHSGGKIISSSREKESSPMHSANYEMFNLQRRNQKSNYLRCYFNAVSCF